MTIDLMKTIEDKHLCKWPGKCLKYCQQFDTHLFEWRSTWFLLK